MQSDPRESGGTRQNRSGTRPTWTSLYHPELRERSWLYRRITRCDASGNDPVRSEVVSSPTGPLQRHYYWTLRLNDRRHYQSAVPTGSNRSDAYGEPWW